MTFFTREQRGSLSTTKLSDLRLFLDRRTSIVHCSDLRYQLSVDAASIRYSQVKHRHASSLFFMQNQFVAKQISWQS
jgi:hypothetical protein